MANELLPRSKSECLIADIKQVVEQARTLVKQAVNSAMVKAYWYIGRLIVEDEQQRQKRAHYRKAQFADT